MVTLLVEEPARLFRCRARAPVYCGGVERAVVINEQMLHVEWFVERIGSLRVERIPHLQTIMPLRVLMEARRAVNDAVRAAGIELLH